MVARDRWKAVGRPAAGLTWVLARFLREQSLVGSRARFQVSASVRLAHVILEVNRSHRAASELGQTGMSMGSEMIGNEPTPGAEMASDPRPQTRRRLARSRGSLFWIVGLGGGILVAFLTTVMAIFGRVSGVEFSPTHFETRQFSFFEIPLLQLQISAIRRDRITPDVNSYLATSSLITRPATPPDTWHLVELRRWALAPVNGEAKHLIRCLDYQTPGGSGSGSFWKAWSQQHPEAARILWPRVQGLACKEQYALIPEVLRIAALRAASPVALREELDRHIAAETELWAADLRAAGYEQLAEDWLRPDSAASATAGTASGDAGGAASDTAGDVPGDTSGGEPQP